MIFKTTNLRLFLFFLILFPILLDANDNKDLIKIKFATDWRAQAEQGGFYHAQALGLYKERGLDVQIIQGSAGVNIPRLLAAKQIHFGMGSNSFVPLNMLSNEIPAKAVMASFQKDPQIIMTHKSSQIESLEEMIDKPIMISENSIGAFWVWLKSKYKFNDKQIRRKTFSLAPFLVNKDAILQGYLTSEPYLVEKELGETPNIFLLSDYGFPGYGAMILARNDIIENNPEIVAAFVEASILGWRKYIFEDPKAGNQLIMRENKEMTEEIIFQAINKMKRFNLVSKKSDLSDVGVMEDERWEDFFKTMADFNVYDKKLNWKNSYSLDFVNRK